MSDLLTRIRQAKELREKATQGEWQKAYRCDGAITIIDGIETFAIGADLSKDDKLFICAAANLPWPAIQAMAEEHAKMKERVYVAEVHAGSSLLCASALQVELIELRAWNAEAKKVLTFYADECNFLFMDEYGLLELGDSNVHLQGTNKIGERARAFLNGGAE